MEIGVVLVIIGLLLAAVLKGKELIASARVGNLIQAMNGYKAAINGFQDRYRIVPGDSSRAATIVGNGAINCWTGCNTGYLHSWESTGLANNHLSAAGFYSGPVPATTAEMSGIASGSSTGFLTNPGGGPIYAQYSRLWQDWGGQSHGGVVPVTGVYTGWNLSSKLLAEVDRKTDDGNALFGRMRNATHMTDWRNCWAANPWGTWLESTGSNNCGAVELLEVAADNPWR